MLSLVICSIKPDFLEKVKANIALTIGDIAYEILAVDNNLHNWPITIAYNYGASKAKYEHLLFIHEDIRFHTRGWGYELVEILQNTSIGLLGLAGSDYKSEVTSAFWDFGNQHYYFLQRSDDSTEPQLYNSFSKSRQQKEVCVVDGFFLAITKQTFNEIDGFDNTLRGFHGYDLDISLKVIRTQKKIIVCNYFTVEHFSYGSLNLSWYSNLKKVHTKHADLLPICLSSFSNKPKLRFIDRYFFLIKNGTPQQRSIALKMLYGFMVGGKLQASDYLIGTKELFWYIKSKMWDQIKLLQ